MTDTLHIRSRGFWIETHGVCICPSFKKRSSVMVLLRRAMIDDICKIQKPPFVPIWNSGLKLFLGFNVRL